MLRLMLVLVLVRLVLLPLCGVRVDGRMMVVGLRRRIAAVVRVVAGVEGGGGGAATATARRTAGVRFERHAHAFRRVQSHGSGRVLRVCVCALCKQTPRSPSGLGGGNVCECVLCVMCVGWPVGARGFLKCPLSLCTHKSHEARARSFYHSKQQYCACACWYSAASATESGGDGTRLEISK